MPKKALAKLFLIFPQSGDELEKRIKFDAYWEILAELQPRFVIEACQYAARGGLGKIFLPSAAELYHAAENFAAKEFSNSNQKLPPPCRGNRHPDEINRVAVGLKALANEFSELSGAGVKELGTTRSIGAVIRSLYEGGEKQDRTKETLRSSLQSPDVDTRRAK